jgi:hypothetical protein
MNYKCEMEVQYGRNENDRHQEQVGANTTAEPIGAGQRD